MTNQLSTKDVEKLFSDRREFIKRHGFTASRSVWIYLKGHIYLVSENEYIDETEACARAMKDRYTP